MSRSRRRSASSNGGALRPRPLRAALLAGVALWLGTAPAGRGAAGDYQEPLRPRVHFTPARNFMNDPNGLVFFKGEHHLFYQHNPLGNTWGHMSWGHAVSRDMLHWQHLRLALREEHGVMIFSGSVVVDGTNTSGFCRDAGDGTGCLVAIYTGHGHGKQTQNLAYSNDRGRSWTKYSGNPVLDLALSEFRDPKVFWHAPARRWVMLTVLADQHKVRFFASTDLKRWDPLSDFGPAGATGGAWECPDLLLLPVEGEPGNARWVLDVDLNPGGRVGGSGGQYFVGTFDGKRFVNDNPDDTMLWVDYGKDFYASLSYSDIPASDGRRIWMGWLGNWLYANEEPTAPWRGVQSLPRQLLLRRGPQGLRLVQAPIVELAALRVAEEPRSVATGSALPASAEIELELARGDWSEAGLRLTSVAGEEVVVGVAADPLEVFVDRRRSRATPFHEAYPERHAGPLRWRDDRVKLRVIFDRTTLEVFANDGETVISDRLYPTRPFERLEMLAGGRGAAKPARLWELRSVWP